MELVQLERGIVSVCERGHEKRYDTTSRTLEEAIHLARVMDGTSSIYGTNASPLPCSTCGTSLSYSVYGYEVAEVSEKPKRKTKKDDEPAWLSCKMCQEQMIGEGPRCQEHNPLPVDHRPLTDKTLLSPEPEPEYMF